MSLLEKMEEVTEVELLTLNCNDGIALEVTGITPRIAKDFVKYQSIEETGWIYTPKDKDKIDLAMWFHRRKCRIKFTLNREMKLNWFKKWQVERKIKGLNEQIDI